MIETRRRKLMQDIVGRRAELRQGKANNGDIEGDIEDRNPEWVIENGEVARKASSSLLTDLPNISLLLLLYTLQGIPMGLSGSIPFLLANKVSYSEQAVFSLVSLPFSLKLLWAPLVDSVYSVSFGRRKSWLVPAQLLCGGMMLWARSEMDDWVGEDGGPPHVKTLTTYFLALYFIMATQDIAVDGWALTMLSHDNVGYGSTCNTIGQTLGFFISQVGFLAFHDARVCNKYFRSEPSDVGMLTLSSFLRFWGVVFLATTTFICFWKPEVENGVNDKVRGLVDTYKQLFQCARLSSVRSLAMVLLTCRMAFAVTDAATTLKLVEYGMPQEEIAMLSPLLVGLGMIIPVAIGRYAAGPKPLSIFLWGYPLRIVVTIVYLWVLPLAREAHMLPGADSTKFFAWLITAVVLHEVSSNCMFVGQMSFFSRVSDPVIGGSYMTLLNTIANVGSKWPNSLSLYLLDRLTVRRCETDGGMAVEASCSIEGGDHACVDMGASCIVRLDGYYVQGVLCAIIGVAWLWLCWRRMLRLQDLPSQAWMVREGIKSA